MNFDKLSPIDKSQVILNAISKKQEVLAENVTNVNTPGYFRKDISFNQILSGMNNSLETEMSQRMGENRFLLEEDGQVDIKKELVEMQKNSMYYAVATRRMTSVVSQIKTVTNVGK